jgi:hypothetical protein
MLWESSLQITERGGAEKKLDGESAVWGATH